MKGCHLRFGLLETSVLFCLYVADPTAAQIVPDATLPNNSTVNLQGTTTIIEGGTTAGSNLFHSFREFSVPTGGEAFFNNTGDIQNIFSRVTGSSISNIDGLIRANGAANLFLLNPNGIIFGPNARLNIGGSFFSSTASSIKFADGMEFSATNPQAPPLLTINVPIGLQYGRTAGEIRVQGKGQDLGLMGATERFDSALNPLEVNPGNTLAIVGGNVIVDGGILQAPGGRVELGGLAAEGTVGINADGSLSFPDGVQRANISIINKAGINVLAAGSGNIAINARNLDISGGSLLTAGIATGLGSADSMAGGISLIATEAITIASSRIENIVNPDATGNGGNVDITTGSLLVTGGALLDASTFGQGNAGSVRITVGDRVSFDGGSAFSTVEATGKGDGGNINITTNLLAATKGARLVTGTRGQGNAGSINITVNSLAVTGGAQLNASTRGKGKAGSVTIDARDQVAFDGLDSQGLPSGAFSNVGETGVGNAGGINITTNELSVTNSAQLIAGSKGQGNPGKINIIARDRVVFSGSGSAFSSVEETGKGEGGSINITTNSLALTNKAQLSTRLSGQGRAGNIVVNASSSVSFDGLGTGFFSRIEETGKGEGGSINITANSVSVTNDAQLNTSTRGQGNAGNITINASDRIWFSNGDAFSFVAKTAVGDAGDININTNSLSVTGGARLISSTLGRGDAGSVKITASDTVSFDGGDSNGNPSGAFSSVEAGAVGKSGSIEINTKSLAITGGAQLLASTRGQGDAGSVKIIAGEQVSFDVGAAFSSVDKGAVGTGGGIEITTNSLIVTGGAGLVTSTEGKGKAGSVKITAGERVSFDGVDSNNGNRSGVFSLVGKGGIGKGGDIEITTNSLAVTGGAQLIAGTKGQGDAGSVKITASDRVSFDGGDVFSSVEKGAVGTGGSIEITTNSLAVRGSAQLVVGTKGQGDAGSVKITAGEQVSFDGGAAFSSVEKGAVGKGGGIEINTNLLTVTGGAQLIAGTRGKGDAGSVKISASNRVSFDGQDSNGNPSGAFSSVEAGAVGQGGNIEITSDSFVVNNGARLTATSLGIGRAGNIVIKADSIRLHNQAFLDSNTTGGEGNIRLRSQSLQLTRGSRITTNATGGKSGGNIDVQVSTLILRQNSTITTNAQGSLNGTQVKGGNIKLDTDVIAALEDSDISANSDNFFGGKVQINAQAIFGTQFRLAPTLESDITATGGAPELSGTVEINTPDVDPSSGLIELPANLVDVTGLIAPDCPIGTRYAANEFFITGRGGIPPTPREALSQNALDVGWVTPNSQAQEGRGAGEQGSRGVEEPHTEIVEATGWVRGANGEIILTANAPTATPYGTWYRSILCPVPQSNN